MYKYNAKNKIYILIKRLFMYKTTLESVDKESFISLTVNSVDLCRSLSIRVDSSRNRD